MDSGDLKRPSIYSVLQATPPISPFVPDLSGRGLLGFEEL